MTLKIRTMNPDDLHNIISLATAEGWNSGLSDSAAFYAADPTGFLIGEVDGKTASIISVVKYGADYSFLGLYICSPEFRGRGHGWAIWQEGIKSLKGRTIGLDGVIAQQQNYAKSGFKYAHKNIRFAGDMNIDKPLDSRLFDISPKHFSAIIKYDRDFFPADRSQFMGMWISSQNNRHTLALQQDGNIQGFGTIRKCQTGYKIGPLFAETQKDADILFQALCARIGPSIVYIDVPEPNAAGLKFIENFNFKYDFECARMYHGKTPDLPQSKIWGNTTFELG